MKNPIETKETRDELSLACIEASPAEICERQAVWDRFFEKALATFTHPNPNLCRDLALDKTIRALGHRPRMPLTAKEREDLRVLRDVCEIIHESAQLRSSEYLTQVDRHRATRMRMEEKFERLCDDAMAS